VPGKILPEDSEEGKEVNAMKKVLDQNYIDGFFGDSTALNDMSNTEIRRAISQLRRQWISCGDYTVGVDPTAAAIYRYVAKEERR